MNDDHLYPAILADPDEDTLRLAYADWLDERNRDGDRDRAELIRLQIRLVGMGGTEPSIREKELLAAHPEWKSLPCPACGGEGSRAKGPLCLTCGGTGDLLVRAGDAHARRDVRWRAGFPDSVSCTAAELGTETINVMHPDGRNSPRYEFVPSAWAIAVVKAFPVTRFVVDGWEIFLANNPRVFITIIPRSIAGHCELHRDSVASAAEKNDDFARAAAKAVRAAVYKTG